MSERPESDRPDREVRTTPEGRMRNDEATGTTPAPADRSDMRGAANVSDTGWLDEMVDVRRRFEELQTEFIEDPRDAVSKAQRLVDEALDRMTGMLRQRASSIQRETGDGDTERLRQAMREYRNLIDSMAMRRAA